MIYKRGKFYWYKFMWNSQLVRESTKQGNDKVARSMESAHRTSLAKGEVGIRERPQVPRLDDFLKDRILPWAERAFGDDTQRKNLKWYKNECRALREFKPLASRTLDKITSETVSSFAAHRIRNGKAIATVNSSIRLLRRALNLAVEWGVVETTPKLQAVGGERHREHVVTPEEETAYLAEASEPLHSIATTLADTGMRPEECFRLRWENVRFASGQNGALLVTRGKTDAGRRVIPMTTRVRAMIEARWIAAGQPREGWVWPAPRAACGHVVPNSIYEPHLSAVTKSKVRPFVLYDLRHTFLTRLGESGIDAWTLARVAGHSNVALSFRYVHPSEETILNAVSRLGGHKTGHSAENQIPQNSQRFLVSGST